MATELGKAYVQIVPSARGISGSISKELGGEAQSAGQSAGSNIAGAIKGAIAAAGIGTAIKSALDAGGALQQSFGGLDTIYGEAAEAAKAYASEAAAAGISANEYAEQAVSFGASLKQAFSNDTTKAVEAANTAILDMADNAAKMGTPIENIQTAYQGFAKQNYTMLDNLKLGYGGTKTEMERLLADASKLEGAMGKTFDINNLGDVYEAIHLVQEDLGLTGVAAAEASGTFTGSMGAMKASAQNLLANLALGNDITNDLQVLVGNVETFLVNNMLPMVENILKALPDLISEVGSIIVRSLNKISYNASDIAGMAINLITALVESIVELAPYLVEAAIHLALSFGEALINTDWISLAQNLMSSLSESLSIASGEIFGSDANFLQGMFDYFTECLPEVLTKGQEIVMSIVTGITERIPGLIDTASELIESFLGFIIENAPTLLKSGSELLINIVNGIVESLPSMVDSAVSLVQNLLTFVVENAPTLIEAGLNLVMNLVNGLISAIPDIIASAATLIAGLLAGLLSHAPELITQGIELIGSLISGLISAIPDILAALPEIFISIKDAFAGYDWMQLGIDLLLGIRDGIMNTVGAVVESAKEAATEIWDSIKDFFDINSPSKLTAYAGEMIDLGLAEGISQNSDAVTEAAVSMSKGVSDILTDYSVNRRYSSQIANTGDVSSLYTLLATYLPQIADKETDITVNGMSDERVFRVTQTMARSYTKRTNQPAY